MREISSKYVDTEDGVVICWKEIACSSSETKPTEGIAAGSICEETDPFTSTVSVYLFDEPSKTWVPWF